MENPHEAEQAVLLERIIKNVDKCNEAIMEMNHCIREILENSTDVELASKLFVKYSQNVSFNNQVIGDARKPV
ncbi:hypothetical protein I317_04392 [Kwoniella heveanensis CBS 569]|uniref:DASH complex subunit DAD4 n=1 Tax=Kwoniella heveanensis BCC8398 TaxID=1296120 RepID=A0A1B9GH72_9TREE|nr:hypothetical protein I316_07990 [Kwoniella heveanensis BCC8398]OCF41786.1 hypothetical protein I317_04392 [Kwoniella heveanensis CBS 569]